MNQGPNGESSLALLQDQCNLLDLKCLAMGMHLAGNPIFVEAPPYFSHRLSDSKILSRKAGMESTRTVFYLIPEILINNLSFVVA